MTKEERLQLRRLCEPMKNGTAVVVPAGVSAETLALHALDTIDALEAENETLRNALENLLFFGTDDDGAYQHAQQVLGLIPKDQA